MAMKKTNAEQLDLFGASLPPIRIDKPIRLIELFGGIGSQAKALERLGVDFERWRLVEWAIPSIKAYAAIHDGWRGDDGSADCMGKDELVAFTAGVSQNYNEPISDERRARIGTKALREIASAMKACKDLVPDVSRVHPKDLGIEKEGAREHAYIMSYSFPCQDLSGAGNRAGMEKGSGTRSGLLWEVERILLELEREREAGRAYYGERDTSVPKGELLRVERVVVFFGIHGVPELSCYRVRPRPRHTAKEEEMLYGVHVG